MSMFPAAQYYVVVHVIKRTSLVKRGHGLVRVDGVPFGQPQGNPGKTAFVFEDFGPFPQKFHDGIFQGLDDLEFVVQRRGHQLHGGDGGRIRGRKGRWRGNVVGVTAAAGSGSGVRSRMEVFLQVMQNDRLDIVRENVPVVTRVLLASAGLAIQKRVIEYKIIGGGVPGNGVGGDVRRNAHRMVLQQDRPHHVPQLRRDPVRSCQEGERVMVIAVYQMDRRLDKVFVAELLFQVLQVMRVRHWRLLVVHIR